MFTFQKKLKRTSFKVLLLAFLIVSQLGFFALVDAQEGEEVKVDYADKVIVDSDLDGLTDEGEIQIFKTDSLTPDTDGDGFFDGAEILNGTDPLNRVDPKESGVVGLTDDYLNQGTPWVWYFSRASGFLAYIFLWFSIFLGLSIRNVFLRKIIKPIYSFDFHAFVSVSAVFWGLFHGISFMFHSEGYLMDFKEIFIPLYSKNQLIDDSGLAFGIILFYVMVVLILTSYFRRLISPKLWRITHFLNIVVLPLVAIHAILIGTDLQNGIIKNIFIQNIFILSVLVLIPLYILNIASMFRLKKKLKAGSKD